MTQPCIQPLALLPRPGTFRPIWTPSGVAPLMPTGYLFIELPKYLMRNVSRFVCTHPCSRILP